MKNNNSAANVLDLCRYSPDRFVFCNCSIIHELVSDSLAFAVAETSELDNYLSASISEELLASL